MNHRFGVIGLALACWAAPGLHADVTIRYASELKPSAALQPYMHQLVKTAQTGQPVTIRMRGNQACITVRNSVQLFDFAKQEVTLMDPARKMFATLPLSQLADSMSAAMPEPPKPEAGAEQLMASMKVKTESKATGATAVIQGVQAEEREIILTMDIPMPANTAQTVPGLKLALHVWTAQKEEALRNPAIRQLTGFYAWQKYALSPTAMLEKIGGRIPGLTATLAPMLAEISRDQAVILRMHLEMYMPFLATVASQTTALDPSAPLLEMNEEVAELSTGPLDAALFEVPKDYAAAPAADLLRSMIQAQSPGAPTPPASK